MFKIGQHWGKMANYPHNALKRSAALIVTANFLATQGATGVQRLSKEATGHQRLGTTLPVEVYEAIQIQNSKTAVSPKNIFIKFYKIAFERFANVLSEYFDKCLEHGYFPKALKLDEVKPIF